MMHSLIIHVNTQAGWKRECFRSRKAYLNMHKFHKKIHTETYEQLNRYRINAFFCHKTDNSSYLCTIKYYLI